MALKNKKDRYFKPAVIESINFNSKTAYIRIYGWDSEEERKTDEARPEKNYTVEVTIPDTLTNIEKSKDDTERLQKMAYAWLKGYKEETVQAETTVNVYPYDEMKDC